MSDLRVDPNWSWRIPTKPAHHTFPPCRIRPDDRFEPQFYLASFTQVKPNKTRGILVQAVASDDAKSVTMTTHKIFEKYIPTADKINWGSGDIQFCIDEVASKLYLIFRGLKQDSEGEKYFHLSISPLSFGEPDRFGHRRVTLSNDAGEMYKINFVGMTIVTSHFFPNPKTGELLFFLQVDTGETHRLVNGKLVWNGGQTRTIEPEMFAKFDPGLYLPDGRSFRFMNKGNRLVVFKWSIRSHLSLNQGHPSLPEQSLLKMYSLEGGQLTLEQNITCDQLELIASIYPPANRLHPLSRFEDVASDVLQLVYRGIGVFAGHISKYTVFMCPGGVALVKNFHRWVESGLRRSKTKHSFLSFRTPNLFREIHQELGEIKVQRVLGTRLYYTVEIRNQTTLHRLELGDHFKDYRSCAYCGIKETSKRRNAQGERIAKFKVCCDCKRLNLHHQWWNFPCHYCSDRCIEKGWEQHKKIHRK